MTPAKHQQNWLPGIFNDFFGNEWIAKTSSAAPAINIVETEKEYEVQIAAPGITKDDFDITVDKENHLVVTVEHKQEESEKDKKGRLIEVYPSLFIVEYTNDNVPAGDSASTYVESYTYSDILTEKNLIRYFDDESEEQ